MPRADIRTEYKGYHATELTRYRLLVDFLLKNPQGVTKSQVAKALCMKIKDIYSLVNNAENVGIMLWETDDGIIGLYKNVSTLIEGTSCG